MDQANAHAAKQMSFNLASCAGVHQQHRLLHPVVADDICRNKTARVLLSHRAAME
jgi:hypothetical protein